MTAKRKIKSLAELASDADGCRADGLRVVLTNGVFDLLHLGHVRYFEEAKRQGDLLFVCVTADEFVNKGPARPHFPHDIRAEMVASLDCVDGVVISHNDSAVPVIEAIKPDIYVKGSDYKDLSTDPTGNITREQRATERHGGHIHFTDDITFSSSELINQYFDTANIELREYLNSARSQNFGTRIPALLDKIAGMKVLVVGETIIDEYTYVAPLGKPPKENVLATLRVDNEVFAGGVIATANHAASFCKSVEVLTCLGRTASYEDLVLKSLAVNVELTTIWKPGPTVRKTRFIDSAYLRKLFEVYTMDDTPDGEASARLIEEIECRAKDFDVVLVNDFGHGMITPEVRAALMVNSKFMALNVQSNAGNFGYNLATKYERADYVCLDAPEARLAISLKNPDLFSVADSLHERIFTPKMILTHGSEGCITSTFTGETSHVPAFTRKIVDTMGAGDAFFAVTGPLAAVSDDLEIVGFVGNAVGAIKVGILGHRKSVEKLPTLAYIRTLLK